MPSRQGHRKPEIRSIFEIFGNILNFYKISVRISLKFLQFSKIQSITSIRPINAIPTFPLCSPVDKGPRLQLELRSSSCLELFDAAINWCLPFRHISTGCVTIIENGPDFRVFSTISPPAMKRLKLQLEFC